MLQTLCYGSMSWRCEATSASKGWAPLELGIGVNPCSRCTAWSQTVEQLIHSSFVRWVFTEIRSPSLRNHTWFLCCCVVFLQGCLLLLLLLHYYYWLPLHKRAQQKTLVWWASAWLMWSNPALVVKAYCKVQEHRIRLASEAFFYCL